MSFEFDDLQSLQDADRYSFATLDELRSDIAKLQLPGAEGVAVIAVGSYGRGEASPDASDFEWLTIYDDKIVAAEEAVIAQAELTRVFAARFGRRKLSINKTFDEVCPLSRLITNVGGEADTNKTLTYRMLALAEGAPLTPDTFGFVLDGLATTYGGSHTAGHRLLSLATDVSRYWRTLRIDYKYKVDEAKKPWAVRSVKLRTYRRMWYFASAVHFVAFGPRVETGLDSRFELADVKKFMASMGGNPVKRFLSALEQLDVRAELARPLLTTYDRIHSQCSSAEIRRHLESLSRDAASGDPRFEQLRDDCRALHTLAADLVIDLPAEPRRELIEMFLL